jgi:hypothetical protein
MNSLDARSLQLVDWVDLKWLMAADGCVIDLDRLQADAPYASRCVDLALASRQPMLRRLAQRLRRHMPAEI